MPAIIYRLVLAGMACGRPGDDGDVVSAQVSPVLAITRDDGRLLLPELLAEVVEVGYLQQHFAPIARRVNAEMEPPGAWCESGSRPEADVIRADLAKALPGAAVDCAVEGQLAQHTPLTAELPVAVAPRFAHCSASYRIAYESSSAKPATVVDVSSR